MIYIICAKKKDINLDFLRFFDFFFKMVINRNITIHLYVGILIRIFSINYIFNVQIIEVFTRTNILLCLHLLLYLQFIFT